MIESLVNDVAFEHAEKLIEADLLLREIAKQNRQATYEEMVWFRRELGWSDITVRDQLRRMNNVLRLEAIAGSPQDRQAALKEAETAKAVSEKEKPKQLEIVEKATAKINQLERDERLSQKRCTEQAEAVEQLRELCPAHIAAKVNEERNRLDATIMRQIYDARTRENELQCCLTPSKYPNQGVYLEMLGRSCPDAVHVGNDGRMIRRSLSPEWPSIRSKMEVELLELHGTIGKLQAEYNAALQPIEKMLDYYTGDFHNAN